MDVLFRGMQKRSIFAQMKFFKVTDFNSKELGSHFNNNEKCLDICWRNLEKSWKKIIFVGLKKWEP